MNFFRCPIQLSIPDTRLPDYKMGWVSGAHRTDRFGPTGDLQCDLTCAARTVHTHDSGTVPAFWKKIRPYPGGWDCFPPDKNGAADRRGAVYTSPENLWQDSWGYSFRKSSETDSPYGSKCRRKTALWARNAVRCAANASRTVSSRCCHHQYLRFPGPNQAEVESAAVKNACGTGTVPMKPPQFPQACQINQVFMLCS